MEITVTATVLLARKMAAVEQQGGTTRNRRELLPRKLSRGKEGRGREGRKSFTSRSNAAPAGKNDSVFQLLLTSSRDWR